MSHFACVTFQPVNFRFPWSCYQVSSIANHNHSYTFPCRATLVSKAALDCEALQPLTPLLL
jgi:hypothetical protein